MATDNFERCLSVTLKWEGGYSNHPDDPGGPTMRGIIQREYDAWRRKNGKPVRPVRQIEDGELKTIYRDEYWDAMGCDDLANGMDLCVFDAAVNSGVGRAREWLESATAVDPYCDERLEYLQRLGRLWRVFGAGWRRRVAGIKAEAHRMAGNPEAETEDDGSLHAGMHGDAVRRLQGRLRDLGYPCGAVDGIFGEQLNRAVVVFQHDHGLQGEPGVWLPSYDAALADAEPMLPRRQGVTHRDLEQLGDVPVQRMNLLQRMFAWLFGGAAAAETFNSDSIVSSVNGARQALEPLHDILRWCSGHAWAFVAVACIGVITLVRLMRSDHVEAYKSFSYQGPDTATKTGGA